jgi:asparagine synthetase B (glutamine-hydrolysing)
VLCWNGEAWKIANERVSGNDTELVFGLFLEAMKGDAQQAIENFATAVASISGPFAFVFYDAVHGRLFFSRDCLGRRSLLRGVDEDGSLKICSLCDGSSSTHFEEVGFEGVYMIDLEKYQESFTDPAEPYKIDILPWSSDTSPPAGHIVSLQYSQAPH